FVPESAYIQESLERHFTYRLSCHRVARHHDLAVLVVIPNCSATSFSLMPDFNSMPALARCSASSWRVVLGGRQLPVLPSAGISASSSALMSSSSITPFFDGLSDLFAPAISR